ncbi:MAG: hypothetical protein AB1486_06515 [Planctomycetota bacterium]
MRRGTSAVALNLTAGVIALLPAHARPFSGVAPSAESGLTQESPAHPIPAEKNLDPAWVASLFARGEPTVCREEELDFIGMPVGGLCAGQLYLGGAGRLWLWDVFNRFHRGVGGRGQNGENYVAPQRPSVPCADLLFDDFEKPTYDSWEVRGTAFGDGPIVKAQMPAYQGDVGSVGERLVNSHNTRHGEDVAAGDAHTGSLLSREFEIERDYITFLIGGGSHAGKTCVNLRVGGEMVASATGHHDNRLQPHSFEVRPWAGRTAQLEIVDAVAGGWGNIGIDQIVFSDHPHWSNLELTELPDFGTMTLALLGRGEVGGVAALAGREPPDSLFTALEAGQVNEHGAAPFGKPLIGGLSRQLSLAAGETDGVTFIVAWHFPNLELPGFDTPVGRFYANEVASHMLWEGLVLEGLAVTRAIHDRYAARKRNPYNEIECSDHYARAMASYGVFIAACGYEYHGPRCRLAFAPRLSPEDFRAAFTAAEGWGSFSQRRDAGGQHEVIEMRHGRLRVRALGFELPAGVALGEVAVTRSGGRVRGTHTRKGRHLEVTLASDVVVEEGERLDVTASFR